MENKDNEDSSFNINNDINNISQNSSHKMLNCFSPELIHDVLEIAPLNELNYCMNYYLIFFILNFIDVILFIAKDSDFQSESLM